MKYEIKSIKCKDGKEREALVIYGKIVTFDVRIINIIKELKKGA